MDRGKPNRRSSPFFLFLDKKKEKNLYSLIIKGEMKDREVEYKYIVSCENSQMKSYLTFVICSKRGAKCFLAYDLYQR